MGDGQGEVSMDLSVKNLSVTFGDKKIFENFSYVFTEGKITCVLGESGIGKSTLLNCIASVIPYEGEIEKDGAVSYIFQEDRLVPSLSVFKNLELVLKGVDKDKKSRKEKIDEMLKLVELDGEEKKIKSELSGGMAQRVAMARAFLYPSKVLLLDEPFKGLDPSLKGRLIKTFVRLYKNEPRTAVFVTHAIDEALLLADKIIMIKDSPAVISFESEIEIEKAERNLSDDSFDRLRKKLLECWEQV